MFSFQYAVQGLQEAHLLLYIFENALKRQHVCKAFKNFTIMPTFRRKQTGSPPPASQTGRTGKPRRRKKASPDGVAPEALALSPCRPANESQAESRPGLRLFGGLVRLICRFLF
jgi:hypothetical protein